MPNGEQIQSRHVLMTFKDADGDIVGLCGHWGLTSKTTVVQELLAGTCQYYVEWKGERLDVLAIAVTGGHALTTSPDGARENYLSYLPDG